MQTEAKNKMIGADEVATVSVVNTAESNYFFPGGGQWKPMTVRAATLQDAEALHKLGRQPVEVVAEVETEAVVEAEPQEAKEEVTETKEEPKVEETETHNE